MVLRPDALHLWGQLSRSLSSMGRYDLVELCDLRNVDAFRAEFELIRAEELPTPMLQYGQSYEKYVIQEEAQKWMKDFLSR